MRITYRVLLETPYRGVYEPTKEFCTLSSAVRYARTRAACRLYWQQEGSDYCGYRSRADMQDEDCAVVRICREELWEDE